MNRTDRAMAPEFLIKKCEHTLNVKVKHIFYCSVNFCRQNPVGIHTKLISSQGERFPWADFEMGWSMVMQILCINLKEGAWFESDFCVSCAS